MRRKGCGDFVDFEVHYSHALRMLILFLLQLKINILASGIILQFTVEYTCLVTSCNRDRLLHAISTVLKKIIYDNAV